MKRKFVEKYSAWNLESAGTFARHAISPAFTNPLSGVKQRGDAAGDVYQLVSTLGATAGRPNADRMRGSWAKLDLAPT